MHMEKLKQKLDYLNEKQLQEVVALMTLLEHQALKNPAPEQPCWQRESYIKRTQGLKQWMVSLPPVNEKGLTPSVSEPSTLYA